MSEPERLPEIRAARGELVEDLPRRGTQVERGHRPLPPAAVQAAAVAGAGAVAGAMVVASFKRRPKGPTLKIGRGRKAKKLSVLGTKTFLVDVTFVDRHR